MSLCCMINQTFTVMDPLISDPILTVPLTSWAKDDLICICPKQVGDAQQGDEDSLQETDKEEHSGSGRDNDEDVRFY